MTGKALVVDANILVRAVLGKRVRTVIETYCDSVSFFVPEAAYAEAEEHLPRLVNKRGGDPERALAFLRALRHLVELIGSDVYGEWGICLTQVARVLWGDVGRAPSIGSSDGDCAPPPSHTTGHAVFRIRRLNPAALLRGKH
jgi:predicted nucleic acid-binding protein